MLVWVAFVLVDWLWVDSQGQVLETKNKHSVAQIENSTVDSEDVKSERNELPPMLEYQWNIENELGLDVESDLQIDESEILNIKIKDLQKSDNSRTLQDIYVLENLYNDIPKPEILWILIEKLSKDYQFEKAHQLSETFVKDEKFLYLDPNLYFQNLLNSSVVSVVKPETMELVRKEIDSAREGGFLSVDSYRYYQWLMKIWYNDYESAKILFKQLSLPDYQQFFETLETTLQSISNQQDIPSYYKDSMIALVLLKYWHFSIAKKLSLESVLKNPNYILPYQILAYSHFLTNSRETAIEYLQKLIDLDPVNESLYKFLVGVSYYWLWNYEKSVLYLYQLEKNFLEWDWYVKNIISDIYKYLVLDYISLEENEKLLAVWQKLLWSESLEKSDFYTYFYEVFYKPSLDWQNYKIYNKNTVLASTFVENCYQALLEDQKDVCIYWEAGLDIVNQKYSEAHNKLLFLAKDYPQSYIFGSLGDFYFRQWELEKAKVYYLKAVSMSDSESEELYLKNKLSDLTDKL